MIYVIILYSSKFLFLLLSFFFNFLIMILFTARRDQGRKMIRKIRFCSVHMRQNFLLIWSHLKMRTKFLVFGNEHESTNFVCTYCIQFAVSIKTAPWTQTVWPWPFVKVTASKIQCTLIPTRHRKANPLTQLLTFVPLFITDHEMWHKLSYACPIIMNFS